MAEKTVNSIKTVGFMGPTKAGKTSFAEILLHLAGKNSRVGNPMDGTSIFDFEPEEKEKTCTILTAAAEIPWKGCSVTLLDMPGQTDYIGEVFGSLQAVETVVITLAANSRVGFGVRKVWDIAHKANRPVILLITHMDSPEADVEARINELKDMFGPQCVPLNYPNGKGLAFTKVVSTFDIPKDVDAAILETVTDISTQLLESIVEADEVLMEQYLEGKEIPKAQLNSLLKKVITTRDIFPILFSGIANDGVGGQEFLDFLVEKTPSLDDMPQVVAINTETKAEVALKPCPDEVFSGQVFKVVRDDYIGKLSYLKILSGTLHSDDQPYLARTGKTIRFAGMGKLLGAKNEPCKMAIAGEIVALTKVEELDVSDTLCGNKTVISFPEIKFPVPMSSLAIFPKTQADEKKLSTSIHRIVEEDPTFQSSYDEQTHELVITGISMLHLETQLKRLKRRYDVQVNTKPPKIRYMETIAKAVHNIEYTHKKQSGGSGQFGRVIIDIEPNERGAGYEFVDKIFGGSIDQSLRPSVNKGVQDKMKDGVIAGYPVCDVKVSLVDGKTHPVDSKDIAFQIAGREAFKKGFLEAKPILLEPIVKLEVTAPSDYFGDISGDISSRRGKVSGMDTAGDFQVLRCEVPLAEIKSYATELRSMTSGQGDFSMEFSHYDIVPSNIQAQIVAESLKEREEHH